MGGWVKNGAKVFPNNRHCEFCLKSECKWCHVFVSNLVVHFRSSGAFKVNS